MKLPHVYVYLCAEILAWHPDRPGARISHEFDPSRCRYAVSVKRWVPFQRKPSHDV
jgi:hypothetical protein